jgi:hypothetical protein
MGEGLFSSSGVGGAVEAAGRAKGGDLLPAADDG